MNDFVISYELVWTFGRHDDSFDLVYYRIHFSH